MRSRLVVFMVLSCLIVLEGLLVGILINWPSLIEAPNSKIKETFYVDSPEASSAYLFQRKRSESVLLFVAVLTHAARRARRDAVRETWFTECKQRSDEVYCAFFTDQAGLDNKTKNAVEKESEENDDLIFLSVEGKRAGEKVIVVVINLYFADINFRTARFILQIPCRDTAMRL